ncbi:MAG: hypothetical protein JETT_3118 [Candidatus Jettenia ecosi]|uniref:Uncharacterized protein n=1 Tax=Candidatus Jettenia ecosi TaxID=2494326 RepID=A0A533QJ83_9BACT|nr:MAG: hypothetical protein JETT_3118 [Candidatus Jettenia ecosi]
MESLIKLEELLLEENSEGVKGYLSEIDRKTANEMMMKAGEVFGFPTIEIYGVVYTHMGMLAKIFGYASTSGISNLVEKHQLHSVKLAWYTLEVYSMAREIFGLSEKDSKATFVTWDTFLIAGMYGQNPEAQKAKLYLLKAERAFRIGMASESVLAVAKAEWMGYRLVAQKVKDEIFLIGQVERIKDGPFKEAAIEALERLTGKTFPSPIQRQLPFTHEVKQP